MNRFSTQGNLINSLIYKVSDNEVTPGRIKSVNLDMESLENKFLIVWDGYFSETITETELKMKLKYKEYFLEKPIIMIDNKGDISLPLHEINIDSIIKGLEDIRADLDRRIEDLNKLKENGLL